MQSVLVAMSGGVDSAVAAHLAAKNAAAAGVTMRLAVSGATNTAQIEKDIADARKACEALGMQHFVADLSDAFARCVVAPFIEAYERGETPNPCVDCNKAIKFGALLDFAKNAGFDLLATGHYARVEASGGRFLLRRAADSTKDQTYMLYSLSQDVLSRVRFPLGDLKKTEVREIAASLGLAAAARGDSQDICFLPEGDYAAFIEKNSKNTPKKGEFRWCDGTVLGTHEGIIRYTVGQRKGLGIAMGRPVFVLSKSAADNAVVLGDEKDLFTRRVRVRDINFIPFDTLSGSMHLTAKARYRQSAEPARVEQIGADEILVEFEKPQRAISPGQSLVLYDGDYVVGGGKICL